MLMVARCRTHSLGAVASVDGVQTMDQADCLFCKIVRGDIPADFVFESDDVVAFNDINPQAPLHVLVIPRRHISTINDLSADDAETVGKLFLAARQIAADAGVAENGYRVAMNCNEDGGQSVYHIHLHVLGGRRMGWPPG